MRCPSTRLGTVSLSNREACVKKTKLRKNLHARYYRDVGSKVNLTVRLNPETEPKVSSTAEAS